ncbi:MAG: 50S ribosomal protein L11 methyltransferase [Acidobacteriota bacterium]
MPAPDPESWRRVTVRLSDDAEPAVPDGDDDRAGRLVALLEPLGLLGLQAHDDGRMEAWLPATVDADALRESLEASGLLSEPPVLDTVEDEHWVERQVESMVPFDLGRRFTVLPGKGEPGPGRIGLTIVPGQAFGTGEHASTQLALGFVEDELKEGQGVLDVGTGTGILALAALALGAGRVVATDIDPIALDVAAETAEQNDRRDALELVLADGIGDLGGRFEMVVANVISGVLAPMFPQLLEKMTDDGRLVLAGLLDQDEPLFDELASRHGLERQWRRDGEWSSALFRRPS